MAAVAATSTIPEKAVIRQLVGTFGAEVSNFDVARVGVTEAGWLREVLRQYKVLVFPDQKHVTPQQLAAFGAFYGQIEVEPHPALKDVDGEAGVKVVVMEEADLQGWGDTWHTDGATRVSTRWLSILKAVEVPDFGRDTSFVDMESAYEHLSVPMKRFLDGLTGRYSWGRIKPNAPDVEHPLVAKDPKTGKKSIYADPSYTKGIKELRKDESDNLLQFLFRQPLYARLQLRVQWKPGMIVMWDNQKTQHSMVLDRICPRVMHRVMVVEPSGP